MLASLNSDVIIATSKFGGGAEAAQAALGFQLAGGLAGALDLEAARL